ncbi:DUF502 domain-containing protein [Rhodovibrionaceae bacterium A322]
MSGQDKGFSATVVYGALGLLPLAVVLYLLSMLFALLEELAEPFDTYFSAFPYLETLILLVLCLLIFSFVCYGVGLLIRTQLGSLSHGKLEGWLSDLLPGYQIISNLLRGVAGKKMAYPAAMIRLYGPGTAVLGFIMEEPEAGVSDDPAQQWVTVFVPTSPMLTVGTVHLVTADRIERLPGSSLDAVNCISQWGVGLTDLQTAAERQSELK